MYSKQTAVAADLGPANTKTFLNFSKVGISVVSAARGKYWHKWIWTFQSFQRRQAMSSKVFNISYMYKSETQVETHSWKGLLFQA